MAASDLDELEEQTRRRIDPSWYDYIAGGADDEGTVGANVEAWRSRRLRPHVLRDVRTTSTASALLGRPVAAPIVLAPTAMHGLVCDDAEAATARAAAACGLVMTLSLAANLTMEAVAAAAPGADRWFQTYLHRDRGFTAELVGRARDAGYRAVVLSVDSPVLSRHRRDLRNGFSVPAHLDVPNMGPVPGGDSPDADLMALASAFDPAVTFDDVRLPTEWCGLPVIVKGLVRGDDARRAIDAGAAAVVVSNHGGRQLDGTIATADALAEVVAGVGGAAPVLVDGGIRSGTDVLKALAMGARAVMVGRPVLWGLGAGGEAGATAVLTLLIEELARAMALCGVTAVDGVTPDLLWAGRGAAMEGPTGG